MVYFRKKFLNRLPPDVSELVPKKALVAHAKLSTYNGTTMNMYLVDKEPMFFDFDSEGVLFPTVYCTRLAPLSFPMLLIHEPVLRNLENGADLMLQGMAFIYFNGSYMKSGGQGSAPVGSWLDTPRVLLLRDVAWPI